MASVEGNTDSEPRRRPPYLWNYTIAGALHLVRALYGIFLAFAALAYLSSYGPLGSVLLNLVQCIVWGLLGVAVLFRHRWAAALVMGLSLLGLAARAWVFVIPTWHFRPSLLLVAALAEMCLLTAPTFRAHWKVGLLFPAAATLACVWTGGIHMHAAQIARQELRPIGHRIVNASFDASAVVEVRTSVVFKPVVGGSVAIEVASGGWAFPVRQQPDGTWSFYEIKEKPPRFWPHVEPKPAPSGPGVMPPPPEMTQAQLRNVLLAAGLKQGIAETARSLEKVPHHIRPGVAGTASLPAGAGQLRVMDEGDILVILSGDTIP